MAAVELAFLLPLLVFACMAAVDFARVAYVQVTLQNCARNGALYEFYKAAGYAAPLGLDEPARRRSRPTPAT